MIRLISFSSVETFIEKENIVADIVAGCKVLRLNNKFYDLNCDPVKCSCSNKRSENLLKFIQLKGNLQEQLMNNENRKCFSHNNSIRYQPRTEYYNDFEICLREYKNQKIKSLQKQTKVHLSDGDGSGSDSDYVDASSELKYQSTTSKSTSHVPTVHQQKQSLTKPTTKSTTTTATNNNNSKTEFNDDVRATARIINQQSNICYDNLQQPQQQHQQQQQQQQPITKCSNNWHEMPQPPLPSSQNVFKIVPLNVNVKMDITSTTTISNINDANQTINKNKNNDVLSIVMTTPVKDNSRKPKTECNNIIVSPVVTPKHKRSSSKKTNELTNSPTGRSKTTTEEASQKNVINVYDKRATTTTSNTIITTTTTTSKPEKRTDVGSASQKQIQSKTTMTVTCTNAEADTKVNNLEDASWGSEREVTLEREVNKSFGISIVGGKVNVSGDALVSGIFIKTVISGSPADQCGQIKVGDRILAVDGNDIRHSSHELAVKTIKNASGKMRLLLQSLNTGNIQQSTVDFIKKLPPPVTPSKTPVPILIQEGVEKEGVEKDDVVKDEIPKIEAMKRDPKKGLLNGVSTPDLLVPDHGECESTSLSRTPAPDTESEGSSDEDDDEDTRDLEGRTTTSQGVEIDRASAGNIRRSKEEVDADPEKENEFGYTQNKIKKRYGALGQVLCHTIDRGSNTNIGISLAGHRDRNKMACFIAGINPKGIASATQLEIGDEILEVNGVVLHGRCHLNASAIIKGLPGPMLQLIVLRRKQAVEDLAVKPVTQFPVEISNEDAFSSFKNVRNVTIKKGNQSLGIMIIEGKHAEVGQGIFVSDIQEGSNAEKAGLNIGDMILAVNKDSLLGCNYDAAAGMLKKTEGIVTLTVCNPNKKETKENQKDGEITKIDAVDAVSTGGLTQGPSRPVTPKPEPSPAKVVVADPYTCEIRTNDNTVIEIKLENQPIGIQVAGGCDTLVNNGAIIVNIVPDSVAAKDKRIQVFDQIIEINSSKMTAELTGEQIQRLVKQVQTRVKMVIYRADPSETETIELELTRKAGKNLGIGFCTGNPKGIFVSDIIPGGIVDLDGRIQKSDIVTHVNSESIINMNLDECSTLLKTVQGKIALKILRAKPKKRGGN